MTCVMCPRTIFMKRKNIWIEDKIFENVISNIETHSNNKLEVFWSWLEKNTPYKHKEVSENGFYFSIVSKCLILHGYGEPFLDKFLIKRLKLCKEKNIPCLTKFFSYLQINDNALSVAYPYMDLLILLIILILNLIFISSKKKHSEISF